jgi:hypothetical protein
MFPAAVGLLALGVIVFTIGMKSASRIAEKQSREDNAAKIWGDQEQAERGKD